MASGHSMTPTGTKNSITFMRGFVGTAKSRIMSHDLGWLSDRNESDHASAKCDTSQFCTSTTRFPGSFQQAQGQRMQSLALIPDYSEIKRESGRLRAVGIYNVSTGVLLA